MAKILVGVTGGIAAYKVCSLVSFLAQEHKVKVIMTPSAVQFVGTVTFQALSNNPVYVDMFDIKDPTKVEHIDLAQWANIMVIAPATASTIGKMANGICDNLLTTVFMALPFETPVVIAPAMNTNMWKNPLMQRQVRLIESTAVSTVGEYNHRELLKYYIVPPASGKLACGDVGEGKLADNKLISDFIRKALYEHRFANEKEDKKSEKDSQG